MHETHTSPLRLCRSCLHIYIYIYIYIYTYTCMNSYQPLATVSQLPAALRRFLKNDAPGLFEHTSCQFSRCSWI